jgi:ATP synthase protein I
MTDDRGGKDEVSFEARLDAARRKQGIDAPKPALGAAKIGGMSAMGVGMRVGVEMLSALVVAVAIGWALDSWLHTKPIMLALFVLLGGAAGIANVWRLMGPAGKTGATKTGATKTGATKTGATKAGKTTGPN